MKTIVAGEKRVCRLLGKQQVKLDTGQYRFMKYLLHVKCSEGVLLHNIITGQLVLLDKREATLLDSLLITPNPILQELVENYYLVPQEFDEKEIVLRLRMLMNRLFTANGFSVFTVLTTTNCNARCFYCYEKNLSRINMDEKAAYGVVNYITANKLPGKINLNWFGGEPLVCAQRIDQICKELQDRSIEYVSTMTSNGYLFDQELILKAKSLWRLEHVQITIDGRRDTYNRVKAFTVSDNNPYERVIGNIKLLLDNDIYVTIRINIDQFNIGEIKELVTDLKEWFGQYSNISIYPHFVLQKPSVFSVQRNQLEEDELIREQITITEQLVAFGLSKMDMSLPRIRSRGCGADGTNSIVIYPDGRLFKCIDIEEKDEIGTIWYSQVNNCVLQEYKNRFELNECGDCPLFPNCIVLAKCPDSGKRNRINCNYKLRHNEEMIKAFYNNDVNSKEQC